MLVTKAVKQVVGKIVPRLE